MDRVKAAIFSSLGDEIIGATVLDLFAGTGALGIEALSRGAASALFVEENSAAVACIERNLARTKMKGSVRKQEVFAFLRSAQGRDPFRIIFADPPYEKSKSGGEFTQLLLENVPLAEMIEPSGIFVLEKRPSEKMPATPLWEITRSRKYGATEVLFLQRAVIPSEVEGSRDETDRPRHGMSRLRST
jgi:16S rRNA (guanine(966)-N(2))-methyltransferase RsmD